MLLLRCFVFYKCWHDEGFFIAKLKQESIFRILTKNLSLCNNLCDSILCRGVDGFVSITKEMFQIPAFNYPRDSIPDYSSILVPNVDNMRTEYLINLMASRGRQVLLIGEQGTAKTVMIQVYCNKYDKEHHLHKTFNFSSTTTPQTFQVFKFLINC